MLEEFTVTSKVAFPANNQNEFLFVALHWILYTNVTCGLVVYYVFTMVGKKLKYERNQ